MVDLSAEGLFEGPTQKAIIANKRRETAWGYVIEKASENLARSRSVERALAAIGLLSAGLGVAQWLLPGTSFDGAIIGFKIALTISAFLCAYAFISVARRGLGRSVHIDTKRGQVRGVWVNSEGIAQVHALAAFEEVSSFFVRPGTGVSAPHRLYMRVSYSKRPIFLIDGDEAGLADLSRDLTASFNC